MQSTQPSPEILARSFQGLEKANGTSILDLTKFLAERRIPFTLLQRTAELPRRLGYSSRRADMPFSYLLTIHPSRRQELTSQFPSNSAGVAETYVAQFNVRGSLSPEVSGSVEFLGGRVLSIVFLGTYDCVPDCY